MPRFDSASSSADAASREGKRNLAVSLPAEQVEWLHSVADRQDLPLDRVVQNLLQVCRTAALSARSPSAGSSRTAPSSSSPASDGPDAPPTDAPGGEDTPALERLRTARARLDELTGSRETERSGAPPEDAAATTDSAAAASGSTKFSSHASPDPGPPREDAADRDSTEADASDGSFFETVVEGNWSPGARTSTDS